MKTKILSRIIYSLGLVAGCFFLGKFLSEAQNPATVGIGLSVGLLAAVLTFIQPMVGLYILSFSMLLSPEIPLAQLTDRAVIVRVDDLLVVLVFFAWMARSAIRKNVSFIRHSALHLPIFAYYSLILLATGFGLLRGEATLSVALFYSLKYVEYVIIFILAVNVLTGPEQIDRLLKAMFIVAGIVLLFSYGVILFQNDVPYCPFDMERGTPEPATLGGYLVLIMGVAWGIFSQSKKGPWSLWLITFWVASVPVIFLTRSRASYFSFAMLLLLIIILERRRRFVLLFMIAVSVVMINFAFPKVYETARQRILYTFEAQGGPVHRLAGRSFHLEQSAQGRVVFWKRAFTYYLPRHPIIGHGVSPRPALEGQIPVVAYETGLLGLLLFIWLMFKVGRESFQLYKFPPSPELRGLGIGFLLGFAGVLVHSLVNTTFIIIRIMEPFWLLVGIIVVARRLPRSAANPSTPPEPSPWRTEPSGPLP